jgi:MFS family permease
MKKLMLAYFHEFSDISQTIWLVMIAVFINAIGSSTNLFLSLYLVTQRHIGSSIAGMILAILGFGAILGSYLGGKLSDKISPHKVSTIMLIGNALVLLWLPLVKHLWLLRVIAFLLGVLNSAFIPANRIALMILSKPFNRVRINALRYIILNLGTGVSVLAAGLLSIISFKWIFVFNGLALLLAAGILLLFFWNLPVSSIELDPAGIESTGKLGLIKQPIFILLGVTAFVAFFFCSQLGTTYPIYLYNHYHINSQWYSFLFIINTLLIVLLQMPILTKLKDTNQYLVAGSGIFLIGLGLFVLPFAHSYSFAIFSCLLWTTGEILVFAIIQTLFYEHAPERHKGKAMSVFQILIALANMIGPAIGMWMYSIGNGDLLWYLCGVLGLCSLLIYVQLEIKLPLPIKTI